ncbi:MAG: InlB B-repeat-containing protein, partial [Spirochaetales bacterium]|nr:InlB B-repeat-containing protein [Spirochaetales bacterium]
MKKNKLMMMLFSTIVIMCFCGCPADQSVSQPSQDSQPIVKYTIHFDANGGDKTMDDINVQYDQDVALSCLFSAPAGKKFCCWNGKADGSDSVSYSNGAVVKNLSNVTGSVVTLYAQWIDNDAHSIFYCDTNNANNSQNKTFFKESDTIELKPISVTGYSFVGWYDGTTDSSVKVEGWNAGDQTSDVILYAKWIENQYTIHFEANGGNGTMTDMTVYYGRLFTLPTCTFTAKGKRFLCWNENADGSGENTFSEGDILIFVPDADETSVTLYAQWFDNDAHRIIYYDTKDANNSSNPIYFREDQTIDLKPISVTGYQFDGWYDGTTDCSHKIQGWNVFEQTSDVSLWGRWTPNKCTIKFAANGGDGTMTDMTVNYGQPVALPKCTITPPSLKKFGCWTGNADGNDGISYGDEQTIVFMSNENMTVTLYAQCIEAETHCIIYQNLNNADNSSNP